MFWILLCEILHKKIDQIYSSSLLYFLSCSRCSPPGTVNWLIGSKRSSLSLIWGLDRSCERRWNGPVGAPPGLCALLTGQPGIGDSQGLRLGPIGGPVLPRVELDSQSSAEA